MRNLVINFLRIPCMTSCFSWFFNIQPWPFEVWCYCLHVSLFESICSLCFWHVYIHVFTKLLLFSTTVSSNILSSLLPGSLAGLMFVHFMVSCRSLRCFYISSVFSSCSSDSFISIILNSSSWILYFVCSNCLWIPSVNLLLQLVYF